jgi:hypothetical protein
MAFPDEFKGFRGKTRPQPDAGTRARLTLERRQLNEAQVAGTARNVWI